MTDTQRAAIAGYRKDGYGYKKISQFTGISENTIKTYCQRNGLGGTAVSALPVGNGTVCKCCGAGTEFTGYVPAG